MESNSFRLTKMPDGTMLSHNTYGGAADDLFRSPYRSAYSSAWTRAIQPGSEEYARMSKQFEGMSGEFESASREAGNAPSAAEDLLEAASHL